MKATWQGTVIAEADKTDLIRIEGNWYFPPRAIHWEYLQENDHHTICPWKGLASYYDVTLNGEINKSAAWYYPDPRADAIQRVKKDFTNYVAFWHGVEVTE